MDKKLREEFWQSFEKSPFIMIRLEDQGGHAEPMTAQLDKDAHHTIWFYTSRQNRVATGGKAMAQFSGKGHDVFACLSGTLTEETDRARFEKHWSKQVEAWFPNGKADARLNRFDISSAELWETDVALSGRIYHRPRGWYGVFADGARAELHDVVVRPHVPSAPATA